MNNNNKIVMIPRELLHPHPDNPRKDLGNLDELKESIKAHGVMQNLTVVPDENDGDGYKILIGHRRFAASEGILEELPCVVAKGLSDREQVGIMLVENIQRSDLSFVEQAHGFQMMMDLGETVETISQKTGFSGATIKHRLEIAKLSDKAINQKREWQLSIGDLIELEKIPNVKERERILKDAQDPMNLRYRIRNSISEMNSAKNLKQAQVWFKKLNIKEDKNASMWAEGIERVCEIITRDENPKDFTFERFEKLVAKHKTLYWQSRYPGDLVIFKKNAKKKEKTKKSAAELAREAKQKKSREIENYGKQIYQSYGNFIVELPIDQAKKVAAGLHIESEVWSLMVKHDCGIASYKVADFIKNYEDREKFWKEIYPSWPMVLQMLLMLNDEVRCSNFLDWNWRFQPETVELYKFMNESLGHFGYNFPEDVPQEILDFDSEMYSLFKEDNENDEEDEDE